MQAHVLSLRLVRYQGLCARQLLHCGCQCLLSNVKGPVCCIRRTTLVDLGGQRHCVQCQMERCVSIKQGPFKHMFLK
jgi:hypothetical protein